MDMCAKAHLKKSGTVLQLKEMLTRTWMRTEYQEPTEVTPCPDLAHPPAEPEHSLPSCSVPEPLAAENASADGSKSSAPTKGLTSVLDKCQIVSETTEDVSNMFTNPADGPPLPDLTVGTTVDVVRAGSNGIIPVAGMIKILQAFDEDPTFIAVLLAGLVVLFLTAIASNNSGSHMTWDWAAYVLCENHLYTECISI